MKKLIPFSLLILAACSSKQKTEEAQTSPMEPNIVSEEITYTADSITMKGMLFYDANQTGARPGIIVVHEWWGLNEHPLNSAKKLAEKGYVAFALDMYGDAKHVETPDEAAALAGSVYKNFDGAIERFNAALGVLRGDEHCNSEEIAAIGFCFGGGIILNMARQGADLDVVGSFHGSLDPVKKATEGVFNGKILVMNGEADPLVSQESIEAFKTEMDSARIDYTFVSYPNALHAFTNPKATEVGEKFNLPVAYNKEADEQSWAALEEMLGKTFN